MRGETFELTRQRRRGILAALCGWVSPVVALCLCYFQTNDVPQLEFARDEPWRTCVAIGLMSAPYLAFALVGLSIVFGCLALRSIDGVPAAELRCGRALAIVGIVGGVFSLLAGLAGLVLLAAIG